MGREDGGGDCEPSSSVMLMKPTRVSKLMTLDQNPPRLAGPGDSRAGRLICIKECGGGLLAGEVWGAEVPGVNPFSKARKMLIEARRALKKGLREMKGHREAGLQLGCQLPRSSTSSYN